MPKGRISVKTKIVEIVKASDGISVEEIAGAVKTTPAKVDEHLVTINDKVALLWMDDLDNWHFYKYL